MTHAGGLGRRTCSYRHAGWHARANTAAGGQSRPLFWPRGALRKSLASSTPGPVPNWIGCASKHSSATKNALSKRKAPVQLLDECLLPPAADITPQMLTAGMVESRMGAVAWAMRQRSVSHPRSSNRTCGFPASGSPTGFIVRHTKEITDRKRHRCDVLSSFASRHSFL